MKTETLQRQFTLLYEAEADAIFRFCLLRVSDRDQAMDLTQETFAKTWQAVAEGKILSNERAFLFTVAHRLVIDWYRKKKALRWSDMDEDESEESFDPPDPKTGNGDMLGAEGRFLLSKISELSSGACAAVYLRFVEGLSPKEIGEILGLTTNVVSVRINRGVNELRKLTGYDTEIRRPKIEGEGRDESGENI